MRTARTMRMLHQVTFVFISFSDNETFTNHASLACCWLDTVGSLRSMVLDWWRADHVILQCCLDVGVNSVC